MWLFKKIKYAGKQVGKYTIETPIGEGRYGICFLARSDTEEKVTIKKFKLRMLKENPEKNLYESRILSKLKNKRIPQFLGVLDEKGFHGFVLEFMSGITVQDMLFKYKHKFSYKEFLNIGIQLIIIIKYLHEKGIVHRDIRIPNVLIYEGDVYLIDFGLARWADENQYPYNLDFSYLGDFLLYLLYSSFKRKGRQEELPWYKELSLSLEQIVFLKKLFGIEAYYDTIEDIERDFILFFKKA